MHLTLCLEQASNGDFAPTKAGGTASTKEAARTVESFNDRLHEAGTPSLSPLLCSFHKLPGFNANHILHKWALVSMRRMLKQGSRMLIGGRWRVRADACMQAVANGDAETVGQAWRDVKSGNVKPDIDSLNQLLRCDTLSR